MSHLYSLQKSPNRGFSIHSKLNKLKSFEEICYQLNQSKRTSWFSKADILTDARRNLFALSKSISDWQNDKKKARITIMLPMMFTIMFTMMFTMLTGQSWRRLSSSPGRSRIPPGPGSPRRTDGNLEKDGISIMWLSCLHQWHLLKVELVFCISYHIYTIGINGISLLHFFHLLVTGFSDKC